VSAEDRRFQQIVDYIENGMRLMPWTGATSGGEFDFEVDLNDADGTHAKVLNYFGRNQKRIDRPNWPGKKNGETAWYYVTGSSKSGFAFDVSAHSFANGITPIPGSQGRTVVVLHVRKAK
jgi:hypothetical protein